MHHISGCSRHIKQRKKGSSMAIETCSSTAKSDQKFTFHPSVSTSQRIIGHHVSETLMMTMTCEVSLLPPGKYLSRMSDLEEKKEFDLNNLRTKACIFNTKELDRALRDFYTIYCWWLKLIKIPRSHTVIRLDI